MQNIHFGHNSWQSHYIFIAQFIFFPLFCHIIFLIYSKSWSLETFWQSEEDFKSLRSPALRHNQHNQKEFLKREKCLYLSNICYLDHCYLENNRAYHMIPFWLDCAEVRMINEKPKPFTRFYFLSLHCAWWHTPLPPLWINLIWRAKWAKTSTLYSANLNHIRLTDSQSCEYDSATLLLFWEEKDKMGANNIKSTCLFKHDLHTVK